MKSSKNIWGIIDKFVQISQGDFSVEFSTEDLYTLINCYINDKNSSTLRELITLRMSGIMPLTGKLNYDGYDSEGKYYEIKPMNVSDNNGKYKKKLDGGGYYTDLTWARHKKYLSESPNIIVSGFLDGLICYIFKFPYKNLQPLIESELERQLGSKIDIPNRYMRRLKFSYKHWFNNCECIYVNPLLVHKDVNYIVRNFKDILLSYVK